MNVLITGGAGYIGSVVTEECLRANFRVTVLDNLSKGHRRAVAPAARFIEGDLADGEMVGRILRENEIEAVIHLAADSQVGESITDPAKYYRNNVANGLILLDAMRSANVRKIVFSSTAAVYGEPEKYPIEETAPLRPANPYGETKLCFENALGWYERAGHLKFASLRYFNAAGASDGCGERHDPETHLIPLILQAAAGRREQIAVYGDDYPTRDGTCVRDYIHVVDLAQAHLLALQNLSAHSAIYNLGCGGAGYTVREVVAVAEKVTGRKIELKIGPRRAGDPAVLVASSDKIGRELGWQPRYQSLEAIIESAWKFLSAKSLTAAGRQA